jgi:predicted RNA-binding Zn-ribbon protein involved in translation (DUF1610 family)
MSTTCAVCGSKLSASKDILIGVDDHGYYFSCPRCGDYQIDSFTDTKVRNRRLDPQEMAVLSHWIRTEHESIERGGRKGPIVLTERLVNDIIKNPHPSPMEQADSLVRWIGDNSRAGETIPVEKCVIEAIVGSADSTEFSLVFDHLKDQNIIIGERRYGDTGANRPKDMLVGLSFPGWERYQILKRATSDSRTAFMAMQYNEAEIESLVTDVLKPAVKQTGFDLRVLRDNREAGLIDNKLRVDIRTARFLIADLTHRNPGAYWEAGFAEGLGKPVIYTCEKKVFEDSDRKPHFDTNHHQTILWDPEKRDDVAKELKATIRATLPAEAKLTDD